MAALRYRVLGLLSVLAVLAGCSLSRQSDADIARHKMIGISKENVLTCMGPPLKKAQVGVTEVWSYNSTGAHVSTYTAATGPTTSRFGYSSKDKNFCTVNVVMKNDVVASVKYIGPRGDMMAPDEQCAYAVEHCVHEE